MLYRNVEIEKVSDDTPSSQTSASEIALDAAGESSVIKTDLQLPNVEISSVITNNNAPVHKLQHVQGDPISIYTCTNAEQMAFPWLRHSSDAMSYSRVLYVRAECKVTHGEYLQALVKCNTSS